MTDTTNATTADLATQRQTLPLRKLQLIGIAGSQEARRALLRTPAGQIRTVAQGDALPQGTVVAIGYDRLILQKNSGERVLAMPGDDLLQAEDRSAA